MINFGLVQKIGYAELGVLCVDVRSWWMIEMWKIDVGFFIIRLWIGYAVFMVISMPLFNFILRSIVEQILHFKF